MEINTSIAIQAIALSVALFVTVLRVWVRLRLEHRGLTAPDYLVWMGWLFTLGWFVCSVKALNIGRTHPVDPETGATDSVDYLKVVFVSCFFFDIGLYWPKASIVVFYWRLIPHGFRRLRLALYVITGYVVAAFLGAILTDTLITRPISDNWSLENQLNSIWNSLADFIINWVLNITTDLLLFCLPFFVLNCLKLHWRQKLGLACIFSLGLITMVISSARFATYIITDYALDDASGNALCTIEMCTATIVVSLPGLKSLVVRARSPANTKERSSNRYYRTSSRQPHSNWSFTTRGQPDRLGLDDEQELVLYNQKSDLSFSISTDPNEAERTRIITKDAVIVTKEFMVTQEHHS
ncbi:hypothetical protein HJFPF1_04490 [Paramyrothecium foliicola]|nr:hypothetical protein HJFPF1_04490 [Paramyrothecium foliicola]